LKKKQKLLAGCRGVVGDSREKVSWFFFLKNNTYLAISHTANRPPLNGRQSMIGRLTTYWVYGGALAGLTLRPGLWELIGAYVPFAGERAWHDDAAGNNDAVRCGIVSYRVGCIALAGEAGRCIDHRDVLATGLLVGAVTDRFAGR
jgi:hypothetical protein